MLQESECSNRTHLPGLPNAVSCQKCEIKEDQTASPTHTVGIVVFNDEGSLVGATIERSAPTLENQYVVNDINIAVTRQWGSPVKQRPTKAQTHMKYSWGVAASSPRSAQRQT